MSQDGLCASASVAGHSVLYVVSTTEFQVTFNVLIAYTFASAAAQQYYSHSYCLQAIDFSDVNDVLQPMTRLQTALLTCMHMEALIPALDLSQLPCLEHLSLQDVYPERLSIPPKCRLDLHGEGQVIQQVCCQDSRQF